MMRNISLLLCVATVFFPSDVTGDDQNDNNILLLDKDIVNKAAQYVKIKQEKREFREKHFGSKYAQKYAKKREIYGKQWLEPNYGELLVEYQELQKNIKKKQRNWALLLATTGGFISGLSFIYEPIWTIPTAIAALISGGVAVHESCYIENVPTPVTAQEKKEALSRVLDIKIFEEEKETLADRKWM